VRVLRVEDRKEFNRAAARNIGAAATATPWLCFVDAGIGIAPNFAETILPTLQAGCYYRPAPSLEGTSGSFVCSRDDFQRAGGYDEVPREWGEEDDDLFDAFGFLGARRTSFPVALLHHLVTGGDQQDRPNSSEPRLNQGINRVYRILKWDTAKLRGSVLTLSMRQDLHRTVSEVVTTAWNQDKPGDLSVRLPYGIVPGGWVLPRSLVYQLLRRASPPSPRVDAVQPQPKVPEPDATRQPPRPVNGDEAG
jgi:hypothetical protein